LNVQVKAITEDIRQLELQSADVDTRLHLLLLSLPNLPHESVAAGEGSTKGEEIRRWGPQAPFFFEPQPHWDLGARLGIIDVESGAKVAGSRFVTLKGAGARLERALISFMLDVHTQRHGYTEVIPPQLVKRSVMVGAGQLPNFESQAYAFSEDELYLNPSADVPLIGMHSDSILPHEMLPLHYVAWTTVFRREAGSTSRQVRGLLHLHQFNKIELFHIVPPEASYVALEEAVGHTEAILQLLELSYRVVALNAAHLPFAAAKTFDLEVWLPGVGSYLEVSSACNAETFQAQRASMKYRPNRSARADYVHTLSGAGLAVGRTMAALLETYQQADGSVVIPKVLRPYMGTSVLYPL
jgi:seryl-tRNA synthetase